MLDNTELGHFWFLWERLVSGSSGESKGLWLIEMHFRPDLDRLVMPTNADLFLDPFGLLNVCKSISMNIVSLSSPSQTH